MLGTAFMYMCKMVPGKETSQVGRGQYNIYSFNFILYSTGWEDLMKEFVLPEHMYIVLSAILGTGCFCVVFFFVWPFSLCCDVNVPKKRWRWTAFWSLSGKMSVYGFTQAIVPAFTMTMAVAFLLMNNVGPTVIGATGYGPYLTDDVTAGEDHVQLTESVKSIFRTGRIGFGLFLVGCFLVRKAMRLMAPLGLGEGSDAVGLPIEGDQETRQRARLKRREALRKSAAVNANLNMTVDGGNAHGLHQGGAMGRNEAWHLAYGSSEDEDERDEEARILADRAARRVDKARSKANRETARNAKVESVVKTANQLKDPHTAGELSAKQSVAELAENAKAGHAAHLSQSDSDSEDASHDESGGDELHAVKKKKKKTTTTTETGSESKKKGGSSSSSSSSSSISSKKKESSKKKTAGPATRPLHDDSHDEVSTSDDERTEDEAGDGAADPRRTRMQLLRENQIDEAMDEVVDSRAVKENMDGMRLLSVLVLTAMIFIPVQVAIVFASRTPFYKEQATLCTGFVKVISFGIGFFVSVMVPDSLMQMPFKIVQNTVIKTMTLGTTHFMAFVTTYLMLVFVDLAKRIAKPIGELLMEKFGQKIVDRMLAKIKGIEYDPEKIEEDSLRARETTHMNQEITAIQDADSGAFLLVQQLFAIPFYCFVIVFVEQLALKSKYGNKDVRIALFFGVAMVVAQVVMDSFTQNFMESIFGWQLQA